jgi:hypothetical protein
MRTRVAMSLLCSSLTFALSSVPAYAQYGVRPASDRATGENYRVEVGGFFWNPTPDIGIASESIPGVIGDRIDFIDDLGLEKSRFKQLKVVLRPATKHKFRFEFTPINYEQPNGLLQRSVIWNGLLYDVSLPVATTLDWNAYRFTYEYDIIYRDRGFLGILLEAKYTDVRAELVNIFNSEFVHARAPIPAVGVIGRGYVAPNISITGEFSAFKLPEGIDEDYRAKFYDFDLYGTVNFTDHFGAQIGYRSFDVFYRIDQDEGALTLKGLYFGGVARF